MLWLPLMLVQCIPTLARLNCSSYDISLNSIKVEVPRTNPTSGIAKAFRALHGRLNAKRTVNSKTGIPCYEWKCQSPEREGFSKCGTTALCDKLSKHPSVRMYRKKEINIFSKMKYDDTTFEQRVLDTIDKDFYKSPILDIRTGQQEMQPNNLTSESQGDFWMDCTAGAFRDFNSAAHLRKYSPRTKIIMIVRDPWQNMGSRITQQVRHGRGAARKVKELTREFKKLQYDRSERFDQSTISRLARITDYAYAEKLLYWKAVFPSETSLLVLDQYDLQVYINLHTKLPSSQQAPMQHKPLDTMYKIEDFLNLSHFTYPESILRSVSHNSNLLKEFAFTNNRSMVMLRSSLPTHLNESDHEIHRPYSFDDKPLLLRLSRSIFAPSLCLFEKLFGWSIHIITESEMPKP